MGTSRMFMTAHWSGSTLLLLQVFTCTFYV